MWRLVRGMATTTTTEGHGGPMEHLMRTKLTETLRPSVLEIHNDSHLHRHHAAMANSTSPETHFRVTIVSDAFDGVRLAQRHRLVYGLLKMEMAQEGGIHALQLRCKTRGEQVRDTEAGKANTKAETCRSKSS